MLIRCCQQFTTPVLFPQMSVAQIGYLEYRFARAATAVRGLTDLQTALLLCGSSGASRGFAG